jgi:phosphodiesterase/alkaline phosphatase D-like protein
MKNTLLILLAATALCAFAYAQQYPTAPVGPGPSQSPMAQQPSQSGQPQNLQITDGPRVESVTGNSAILAWSTNIGSSAIVHYGTDPKNLSQMAEAPWSNSTHRVTLSNLQPNTTYYFQVESSQGQGTGTGTMSAIEQFRTPAQ